MTTACQWEQVLDRIDALPPAPQILPKLLRVLAEPDTDVSQVTDLIAYDPGLTSKVLQLCNSAWLANATPVTDIGEAVNRLGLRCIYRLVAAVNGRLALRPTRPVPQFDPGRLWRHSVITALAAQFLAQDHGCDDSAVFTTALLHDAGQVVLAQAFGSQYGAVLHPKPNGGPPLEPVLQERAIWGVDHAEAGGRLLARWQFPEVVVAAVTHHHQPEGASSWAAVAACVNLAEALAIWIEGQPGLTVPPSELAASEALRLLQLRPERLEHYRDRTLENFEFVNALAHL